MISGFSHATLRVSNLVRSTRFYCDVLGFEIIHEGRTDVHVGAGAAWLCLLERAGGENRVAELPVEEGPGLDHLAFSIAPGEFEALVERLTAAGVRVIRGVMARGDGHSFNFLDPDGIQLEIHTGTPRGRV